MNDENLEQLDSELTSESNEEELTSQLNDEASLEEKKSSTSKKRIKKEKPRVSGKVDASALITTLAEIEKESHIPSDEILTIFNEAMQQAYLENTYPGIFKVKMPTDENEKAELELAKENTKCEVEFNAKLSKFAIYDLKVVTEEDDIVDDAYQISLEDAVEYKKRAKLGDTVRIPVSLETLPRDFIKRVDQLFYGKFKDAARNAILLNYKDQMGGLIIGTVTSADQSLGNYEVSFGKADGFLRRNKKNLLPNDVFAVGDKVVCYLERVNESTNPLSLEVSRTTPKFVLKLMEREIPEVAAGIIEVKGIAREPGKRTKIFVKSNNKMIDAVSTCIGPETSRQRAIGASLRGEKIEFVQYVTNKAVQIINAMVPADVIGLTILDDFFDDNVHFEEFENDKNYVHPEVTCIVTNGGQGTAIGSEGSNVRLASRLTKCKLTVLQIDEAMKNNVHFMMKNEILKMAKVEEDLPKVETTTENLERTPTKDIYESEIDNSAPISEIQFEDEQSDFYDTTPRPSNKSIESNTNIEEQSHIEITNKPRISLELLEKQLEESKKKSSSQYTKKKKFVQGKDNKAEDESEDTPKVEAMPIYTEEELKNMDENEDSQSFDDEDEDYDEYDDDSYYGDDDK